MLTVLDLRCEHLEGPVVLDEIAPRFSWRVESTETEQRQTAYEIAVIDASQSWDEPLWNTGRVSSAETTEISYRGPAPQPLQDLRWRVRSWDKEGVVSQWSQESVWRAGFLANENWSAQWIQAKVQSRVVPPGGPTYSRQHWMMMAPTMHLRRPFEINGPYSRATVYATARGVYQLSINGERVGDHELAPGWTDYDRRHQYQAFDVTEHLKSGGNVLGALLGEGWYAGMLGFNQKRPGGHYGSSPELLVELHIEHTDGRVQRVCTDHLWKCSRGPRTWSDIVQGEMYNSANELPGWDTTDFEDSSWCPAAVVPDQRSVPLVAEPSPPIRVTRKLVPTSTWKNDAGNWVVDFGQYISGVTELTVHGEAGSTVSLKHGEWLDGDSVYVDNLHSASSTDVVTLRGGRQRYRPLFTQHGFQFVEIIGLDGDVTDADVVALQFHTDNSRKGFFECSDPDLTMLAENADRTLRSNSMSIPTCEPARDERMAYLGDVQIASATAMYLRDHAAFYSKWTDDILDAADGFGGLFTNAAPTPYPSEGAPGWGDGGIILPWTMYRFYGDLRVIDKMWTAMSAWMDSIHGANPDHIRRNRLNSNYNDWLVPGDEDLTPPPVLATAYWYWCARLMSEMASVTGRGEESKRYGALAEQIANAFATEFISANGLIEGDTQTVYAMAFRMGLVPSQHRTAVANRFQDSVTREDNHVRVGFAGVGFILPALQQAGLTETAYSLMLDRRYPSWLYSVRRGATSIWERWNTITEDGSFPTPVMNTFSLVVLGSAVEWLFRGVAGINTVEAEGAMRKFAISPTPGPGLTWAKATHVSPYGEIVSEWRIEGELVHYAIQVPTNTTATIVISSSNPSDVDHLQGTAQWVVGDNAATALIGSGRHEFTAPLPSLLLSPVAR